jgi:hypothetical protein
MVGQCCIYIKCCKLLQKNPVAPKKELAPKKQMFKSGFVPEFLKACLLPSASSLDVHGAANNWL